jgi:hypothetical protein
VLVRGIVAPSAKATLRGDIGRLLQSLPDPEPSHSKASAISPLLQRNRAGDQEGVTRIDTPAITALRERAIGLHKQRSDLKGRLLLMSLDEPDRFTDGERYEVAASIMGANVQELDSIYDALREYEQTGTEPALPADRSSQQHYERGVQDMRSIATLRSRISRLRRQLRELEQHSGTDDSGQGEAQQRELAELEDKLDELRLRTGQA